MANGEREILFPSELDHRSAVAHGERHRLFQKHMLALIQCRGADFKMRVARRDDIDDVKATLRDHFQWISKDARLGIQLARLLARSLRRRSDGNELSVGIARDGLRVEFPPGAEAGECETDGIHGMCGSPETVGGKKDA